MWVLKKGGKLLVLDCHSVVCSSHNSRWCVFSSLYIQRRSCRFRRLYRPLHSWSFSKSTSSSWDRCFSSTLFLLYRARLLLLLWRQAHLATWTPYGFLSRPCCCFHAIGPFATTMMKSYRLKSYYFLVLFNSSGPKTNFQPLKNPNIIYKFYRRMFFFTIN